MESRFIKVVDLLPLLINSYVNSRDTPGSSLNMTDRILVLIRCIFYFAGISRNNLIGLIVFATSVHLEISKWLDFQWNFSDGSTVQGHVR